MPCFYYYFHNNSLVSYFVDRKKKQLQSSVLSFAKSSPLAPLRIHTQRNRLARSRSIFTSCTYTWKSCQHQEQRGKKHVLAARRSRNRPASPLVGNICALEFPFQVFHTFLQFRNLLVQHWDSLDRLSWRCRSAGSTLSSVLLGV